MLRPSPKQETLRLQNDDDDVDDVDDDNQNVLLLNTPSEFKCLFGVCISGNRKTNFLLQDKTQHVITP